MKRLTNQRGIAMITVLWIGAALTVISSSAAIVTIREFRSGIDDRKAAEALSYAESGIDRFMQHIRNGYTWGALKQAGCEQPALTIPDGVLGNGRFAATATVFNPAAANPADRFPIGTPPTSGGACAPGARPANGRSPLYMAITSTGTHPNAKRVVRQVVKVETVGLPIGVYAESIDASGTPQTIGISMISETKIIGREKLFFTGLDPYYTLKDFWPGASWTGGASGDNAVPSAAHAVQGLYMKPNGNNPEFAGGPKNCTANGDGGQSLWDGDGTGVSHGPITSGCPGQTAYPGAYPPDSEFNSGDLAVVAPRPQLQEKDYQALKGAAQGSGLYCRIPTSGAASCTMLGVVRGNASVWQDGDIAPMFAPGGNKNFIAYFEFVGGDPLSNSNSIKWGAEVWSCNNNPNLTRSAVIIVRNGGVDLASNAKINGALLLEDGEFKYSGTPDVNGSIIAKKFTVSGNATFSMDPCWVQNMPSLFFGITPLHWSEIDR